MEPGHDGQQAARNLFGNVPADVNLRNVSDAWSMQHPVLYTLICAVMILVVFVPLAVRRYRSATTR